VTSPDSPRPDHYLHQPGAPARSGVLDLGLKCVHSCRFCYYSFHEGSEDQFAPLRKAGLIVSVRGAQGGYVLSRSAAQISVGDVIRVLEGPIGFTDCSVEGEPAPDCAADCAVHGVWEKVTQQIVSVIDSISLQDLVEQSRSEQARQTLNFQI